jgi:hypothetical protein
MADEMEPEAGPFALLADLRCRQPDLGHEGPTGELGEHPSIDLVGLGRQGGQAPDTLGVGDQDLPARELEAVVDEAGAVHRLDRGPDRLALSRYPSSERSERIGVRSDSGHQGARAVLTEYVHIEPLSR